MSYAFGSITWEDALREFLIHLQAYRAPKTVSLYRMLVGGVVRWAGENKIRFHEFGKRHLDRYLSMRIDAGISAMTLHQEALAMKVFQR